MNPKLPAKDDNDNVVWHRRGDRLYRFANDLTVLFEENFYDGVVEGGQPPAFPVPPNTISIDLVDGRNGRVIGSVDVVQSTMPQQIIQQANVLIGNTGVEEHYLVLAGADSIPLNVTQDLLANDPSFSVYKKMTEANLWKHEPLYVIPTYSTNALVRDLEGGRRHVMFSRTTTVGQFRECCLEWYDTCDHDSIRFVIEQGQTCLSLFRSGLPLWCVLQANIHPFMFQDAPDSNRIMMVRD